MPKILRKPSLIYKKLGRARRSLRVIFQSRYKRDGFPRSGPVCSARVIFQSRYKHDGFPRSGPVWSDFCRTTDPQMERALLLQTSSGDFASFTRYTIALEQCPQQIKEKILLQCIQTLFELWFSWRFEFMKFTRVAFGSVCRIFSPRRNSIMAEKFKRSVNVISFVN